MISREVTGFLIHQVVSTTGVAMLSAMSWYSTLELLKLGQVHLTTQATALVLLGIPGFPFQGASGFILGFALARQLRAKSVSYVWILPLLWFCFGALAVAPSSKLAYLIGGACKVSRGCFYQVLFTLPLVASVLYAVGAVVSRWSLQRSSRHRNSSTKTAMPDEHTESKYGIPP
jgi:hypothetical protein